MFNINNSTIDSELQIANEFNNYFASIGPKLESYQTPTTLNPFNSLQCNANSVDNNNYTTNACFDNSVLTVLTL